jgi:hypothetical protein
LIVVLVCIAVRCIDETRLVKPEAKCTLSNHAQLYWFGQSARSLSLLIILCGSAGISSSRSMWFDVEYFIIFPWCRQLMETMNWRWRPMALLSNAIKSQPPVLSAATKTHHTAQDIVKNEDDRPRSERGTRALTVRTSERSDERLTIIRREADNYTWCCATTGGRSLPASGRGWNLGWFMASFCGCVGWSDAAHDCGDGSI